MWQGIGDRSVFWLAIICCLTIAPGYSEEVAPPVGEYVIPFKQTVSSSDQLVNRVVVVSLLGIMLCVVATLVLKKVLQSRGVISETSSTRMMVVETKRLTPKLTVFLLKVDSINYVLAQAGDELQLIKHKSDGEKEYINEQ